MSKFVSIIAGLLHSNALIMRANDWYATLNQLSTWETSAGRVIVVGVVVVFVFHTTRLVKDCDMKYLCGIQRTHWHEEVSFRIYHHLQMSNLPLYV